MWTCRIPLFCLWRLNVESYFEISQKVMVYKNCTILEIQVSGKSIQLDKDQRQKVFELLKKEWLAARNS